MRLLILFLLVGSLACETVVDVDLPKEDEKLVINSYLHPDSALVVELSSSLFILDQSDPRRIKNADISLYENDKLLGNLKHLKKGTYVDDFNFQPMVGKTYTIKASKNGYEDVEAKITIPEKINILKVDTLTVQGPYSLEKRIAVSFKDNGNQTNYYQIELFGLIVYREDSIITKGDTTIIIPGDSVYTIEKYYYWSDDPVFGNSNGGYSENFFFTDDLINGQNYSIEIPFNTFYYDEFTGEEKFHNPYSKIYVKFNHLAEETYLYNVSLEQNRYSSEDPFSAPVRVYTNVENGYGIFGASNSDVWEIDFN